MWPLELTATPEASPRFMSGGSFSRFGTESKGISGGCCCANADGLSSMSAPTSQVFMRTSLVFCLQRLAPSIQRGEVVRQSGRRLDLKRTQNRPAHRNSAEIGMVLLGIAAVAAVLTLAGAPARADAVADFYKGKTVTLVVGYG